MKNKWEKKEKLPIRLQIKRRELLEIHSTCFLSYFFRENQNKDYGLKTGIIKFFFKATQPQLLWEKHSGFILHCDQKNKCSERGRERRAPLFCLVLICMLFLTMVRNL